MPMRVGPARMPALLLASLTACLSCAEPAPPARTPSAPGVVVNDVHSQLNETRVNRVTSPDSVEAIREIIRQAREEGRAISIAGARHAMGAQQFGTDTLLLDMTRMDKVL